MRETQGGRRPPRNEGQGRYLVQIVDVEEGLERDGCQRLAGLLGVAHFYIIYNQLTYKFIKIIKA